MRIKTFIFSGIFSALAAGNAGAEDAGHGAVYDFFAKPSGSKGYQVTTAQICVNTV